MVCPVCNSRKAKRACPALGKQICALCCGTKRLVEIACPADCGYLSTARTHPPAVIQRQQDMDRSMMLPLLQGLSERQARLFLMMSALTAQHRAAGLQRLVDEDIAEASGALASTLETAGRGIVYEHQPASLIAARLMSEMKTTLDEVVKNAGSALERDAAIALRRVEHGAKTMVAARASGAHPGLADNEFQQLLARVLAPAPGTAAGEEAEPATAPASSIILPPG